MAGRLFFRNKKALSLSGAQRGMRLLGIFHYLLGAFLIWMIVMLFIGGPEMLGALVHEQNSPNFAFLDKYDDWVTGMSFITILMIQAAMELFTGWSCRRKSLHPDKMMLTLLLSGAGVLGSAFTLLKAGFHTNVILDAGYSLLLNLVTFLLAFRIRRDFIRSRKTEAQGRLREP